VRLSGSRRAGTLMCVEAQDDTLELMAAREGVLELFKTVARQRAIAVAARNEGTRL